MNFIRIYTDCTNGMMSNKPKDVVQHPVVQLPPVMTLINHMNEVKPDDKQNQNIGNGHKRQVVFRGDGYLLHSKITY